MYYLPYHERLEILHLYSLQRRRERYSIYVQCDMLVLVDSLYFKNQLSNYLRNIPDHPCQPGFNNSLDNGVVQWRPLRDWVTLDAAKPSKVFIFRYGLAPVSSVRGRMGTKYIARVQVGPASVERSMENTERGPVVCPVGGKSGPVCV